jgi:transglutaminase-like putative cysteine protease/tetratricopeptide (TPR) repeat protein
MISRQLRYLVTGAFFLAAVTFASAQTATLTNAKGDPAASDPYRDEPYVFEKLDETYRMHADGTGEMLQHVQIRVQSEGTARQFSVLSFPYASANQEGIVDFVRVHKADGTTIESPVADAMEMPAEVTRQAPVYSDIKEKHVPVRSLSSGDKLEYQFRIVIKRSEAPGQFWGAEHFAIGSGVVLSQTVTLEVPASTYVQVWSPNHPVSPTTHDGVKTWQWTSSQSKPSRRDETGKMTAADVKDPDEDSDGRKLPSVAWTTFHDWAQVGAWYHGLIEPRAQPTAAIRTKADELTKAAKTPQEQAEALYRFVAANIRYVSIGFGIGRIQPHAADEVLANGYGDCKDKDTLLEALLRAKGLTTSPVLIGAGIALVPEVPSPAAFNHEITTVELPGTGRIWLDSTAEVAPFRVLSPVIRDQQALLLPEKGVAILQKTPADPPYPYKERFESVGTLSDKDILKVHIQMSVRSDSELGFRAALRQVAPAQWDQMMQGIAAAMNFGGKVSNTDLRQNDPTAPAHIAFDYTREDYGNWKDNRIWPVWPTLEITYIDKEKAPEHDIDLGAPRTLEVESTITVPEGYRMELPSARNVDRPYSSYDETYRFVDGKFIADRVVVVKQHKLNKDQWKDYLAFVKEAGLEDSMQEAVLIPSDTAPVKTATSEGSKALPEDSDNATAKQLQEASVASERKNDWVAARRYAEKAVAKFPEVAYSHSVQAYVDEHDKKYDEAIAGYKEELVSHPDDNSNIVRLLAGVYSKQKRYGEAVEVLKRYSNRKDLAIQWQLISVQNLNDQPDEALKTLRQTLEWKPDDKALQTEEARLLQLLHRNSEAAVAAKRALEGNNDPDMINSNAYFLAETRQDLPLAESSSRRSVEMFDRLNSTGVVDEANTRAFALSSGMVAAWDTLGDILLIEDKAKAAEAYIAASWFEAPDAAKGNHLSEVYERLGRKQDALLIAKLTSSLKRNPGDKDDLAAVEERQARLEKAGVKLPVGKPASLQEMRTFHLKNTAGVQGSGVVRAQLGGEGIHDATLVSGDESLKPLLNGLKSINIPPAVPPASPAHVLRDGVLYCGKGSKECEFVFMEHSGIAQESAPK